MPTLIAQITRDILSCGTDLKDVALVVPGRRAGLFFRREIVRQDGRATFLPRIYTIEDLAEKLSRLQGIDNIPLLFEFYEAYHETVAEADREPFDVFARWGQTLLADFNEIDRYMLPHEAVFSTLQDVEHIEGWDPAEPISPLMAHHKNFWHLAEKLYSALWQRLLGQGKGYAGMITRRAAENLSRSAEILRDHRTWIFAGFNALSQSEEEIVKYFVREKGARVYYDGDKYYMDNPRHSAGTFLRRAKDDATLGKDFKWNGDFLSARKKLRLIGVPKRVAQAKVAGEVLKSFLASDNSLENTALVLADESLLIPMLSSLPLEIPAVNVTMGYPLSGLPSAGLADGLLALYSTPGKLRLKGYYYKDVLSLLRQNICSAWLTENGTDYAEVICRKIVRNDIVDFRPERLGEDFPENIRIKIELLFPGTPGSPLDVCRRVLSVVDSARQSAEGMDDLTREYLFKLSGVFSTLCDYMERYPYIENLPTLAGFYRQGISRQKIDFYGEPLEGLQLMGLLETRLLDFKNLILCGVNEGTLPAGRSDNSFIPYDVKRHFELPTYSEMDAIYSYHFFRLLQRAENVTIVYNTEQGDLGQVEPSRFLLQLKHDFKDLWDIEELSLSFGAPELPARTVRRAKSELALGRIREILSRGISPSALNMYLCNPMEFYYRKVLGIEETEEVEETAAANTMGSIVHEVLSSLYEGQKGIPLTPEALKEMDRISDQTVKETFLHYLRGKDFSFGRNYLVFEAVKRMVKNFIAAEEEQVARGARIVIQELETTLECPFESELLGVPIVLKGQADRIDLCDGTLRIVDYKTGRTDPSELRLESLEQITAATLDPRGKEIPFTKPKALQVLMYAYMYAQGKKITGNFNAGIISLRNPSAGLIGLNFTTEKARTYRYDLTSEDLSGFRETLERIFTGMLDPDIPFDEVGPLYYEI